MESFSQQIAAAMTARGWSSNGTYINEAYTQLALATLAREELGMGGEEDGSAWVAAITSFLTFSFGAVLPVLPWLFFSGGTGIAASAVASGVGLFLTGAVITLYTGRSVLFSGARMLAFGLAAAAITFGIGRLIGVNTAG